MAEAKIGYYSQEVIQRGDKPSSLPGRQYLILAFPILFVAGVYKAFGVMQRNLTLGIILLAGAVGIFLVFLALFTLIALVANRPTQLLLRAVKALPGYSDVFCVQRSGTFVKDFARLDIDFLGGVNAAIAGEDWRPYLYDGGPLYYAMALGSKTVDILFGKHSACRVAQIPYSDINRVQVEKVQSSYGNGLGLALEVNKKEIAFRVRGGRLLLAIPRKKLNNVKRSIESRLAAT